jgi:hypothetical protein
MEEELALEHEHVSSEIIGENLEAAVEKKKERISEVGKITTNRVV